MLPDWPDLFFKKENSVQISQTVHVTGMIWEVLRLVPLLPTGCGDWSLS